MIVCFEGSNSLTFGRSVCGLSLDESACPVCTGGTDRCPVLATPNTNRSAVANCMNVDHRRCGQGPVLKKNTVRGLCDLSRLMGQSLVTGRWVSYDQG